MTVDHNEPTTSPSTDEYEVKDIVSLDCRLIGGRLVAQAKVCECSCCGLTVKLLHPTAIKGYKFKRGHQLLVAYSDISKRGDRQL